MHDESIPVHVLLLFLAMIYENLYICTMKLNGGVVLRWFHLQQWLLRVMNMIRHAHCQKSGAHEWGGVLHRGPRPSRRCFGQFVCICAFTHIVVLGAENALHDALSAPRTTISVKINAGTNAAVKISQTIAKTSVSIHLSEDQGHTIVYSFTRNGRAWWW